MPEASSCRVCGGDLIAGAAFCPHCGTRAEPDVTETAAIPVPPNETGPVPVHVAATEPHLFGVTPPLALLGLGVAALAVAVLLLALGRIVLGVVVLVAGALLLAAFLAVARRKPDSAVARASASAFDGIRGRAGFAAASVAARSSARREIGRLLRERAELDSARQQKLLALGLAVYGSDKAATVSLRGELRDLDSATAAKEAEMAAVTERARQRVNEARLEVQPTEVVDPGGVASVPEPAPSPQPAPVPHTPPEQPTTPLPGPQPPEPGTPLPEPPQTPEPPAARRARKN